MTWKMMFRGYWKTNKSTKNMWNGNYLLFFTVCFSQKLIFPPETVLQQSSMCNCQNHFVKLTTIIFSVQSHSGVFFNSVCKFKADALITQMQHHVVNATKCHYGSDSFVKGRLLLVWQHFMFSFLFQSIH